MFNSFLKTLINVSEKAANIARTCRENEHLFSLLVEEKSETEKNPRFVNDFKTLADVLIQETARHDIVEKFPILDGKIYGEENSTFRNALGEEITVKVMETIEETKNLLEKVLDGNREAAKMLAVQVHGETAITDEAIYSPPEDFELNLENLGIVIDPIDATQEYIRGGNTPSQQPNIPKNGLACVTVLIGVFNQDTGVPVIGVINQPFGENEDGKVEGQIYWGVSYEEQKHHNIKPTAAARSNKLAILSPSELPNTISILENIGYEIVYSAGAGHKILKLITGDVDLYLLSKNTTFKWDVCAPHAILSAQGFHLIDLTKSLDKMTACEISYRLDEGNCNQGGVMGYRTDDDFQLLTQLETVNYSMQVFIA